jgi:hypothetical protein
LRPVCKRPSSDVRVALEIGGVELTAGVEQHVLATGLVDIPRHLHREELPVIADRKQDRAVLNIASRHEPFEYDHRADRNRARARDGIDGQSCGEVGALDGHLRRVKYAANRGGEHRLIADLVGEAGPGDRVPVSRLDRDVPRINIEPDFVVSPGRAGAAGPVDADERAGRATNVFEPSLIGKWQAA